MPAHLIYLKLELKRACKKFPRTIARAIVLLLLAGAAAFLVSKMLYGKRVSGRVTVGAVLSEGDAVAKEVVAMVSSLESVKSICDFEYMDREEEVARLRAGKLFGVMEVLEGLIQDTMNGANAPMRVTLPERAGLESQIFRELTDTSSRTLGVSQAGTYAGNKLRVLEGMTDFIPHLEANLNRISMGYSLPRTDYFKNVGVTATGDVDTYHLYGISALVLFLLLCVIPASAHLSPASWTMRQKLSLIGVGSTTVTGARTLGLGLLMGVTALLVLVAAWDLGWIIWSLPGILSAAAVCVTISFMVVLLYQAAGSLMGGVMLLSLAAMAMYFLVGGFSPLTFLPTSLRTTAALLPVCILMEGVKMAMTSAFSTAVFCKLAVAAAVCSLLSLWVGVGRR